jgi:hypothetical protein
MPERAPLLSSYLSSSTVGRCLHLWSIFSYVMPYFGFGYLVLYLRLFKAPLFFFLFHLRVYASLLSGFLVPFLCLKGLVCTKLFAMLGCYRTLCPFFLDTRWLIVHSVPKPCY